MESCDKKNLFEEEILGTTQSVEEQINSIIERLCKLNLNNLSEIKKKKIALMKKDLEFKEDWILNGHGEYSTLLSEKEVIDTLKKSERVVLHACSSSTLSCEVVDKHLNILAKRHFETKFCKLDVEKAPYLCHSLKIRVIPTIVLFRKNEYVNLIVGFDDFEGVDVFSTEMMEWRLARAGVITYDGDLTTFPEPVPVKKPRHSYISSINTFGRKNLRRGSVDSDDEGDLNLVPEPVMGKKPKLSIFTFGRKFMGSGSAESGSEDDEEVMDT